MKKIAIMGARGFVGKNLAERLANKYEVYPITRKQISLLDTEAVECFIKEKEIDVIINCANQGGARKDGYNEDKADIIGNNLKMFFNMERCLTPDMKMINFGSGAQYNKTRDLDKIIETEVGTILPEDDYGYSKYVLSKYINASEKEIYNPIIFGLYGQYEDYTYKFISNAIVKNLLKMPIVINQNVIFDYLYIDDLEKIVVRMIEEKLPNKEFNITPTKSIDLVTLAELVNECGEFKSEILVRNPGLNYKYTGDNGKLLENMGGNFAFTSYREGVKDLYKYYQNHLQELDLDTVRGDKSIEYCKTK